MDLSDYRIANVKQYRVIGLSLMKYKYVLSGYSAFVKCSFCHSDVYFNALRVNSHAEDITCYDFEAGGTFRGFLIPVYARVIGFVCDILPGLLVMFCILWLLACCSKVMVNVRCLLHYEILSLKTSIIGI